MDKVDEVVLETILRQLPSSTLAAAQLACRHWSNIILGRELWKVHAVKCAGKLDSPPHAQTDWRRICLDSLARHRWHDGKLVLSATLQGHSASVTCIAAHDDVILTGSADSTARVWPLQQQQQQQTSQQTAQPQQQQQPHVLRHPAPVVAVAIVSRDICVTATASRAYLWRRGAAVRSFDVMPGGSITCLALTDTQLLLGSTAATVQQYDLYSGVQQLITRYDRAVTALLPLQQQGPPAEQDWRVLVGTVDGEVICTSCSTGQQLWKLPNTYRAKIIALQPVQHHHLQNQQSRPQHGTKRKRQQDHGAEQQRQQQLLLVLNDQSQLTCWRVPSAISSSSSSGTRCPSRADTWPLAVLNFPRRQEWTEQVRMWKEGKLFCTCMAVPEFGSSCLMLGSHDGSLTVVAVVGGSAKAAAVDAGTCVATGNTYGNKQQLQQQQQQQQPDVVSSPDVAGTVVPLAVQQQSANNSTDRSHKGEDSCQLDVVRRCPLSKLADVLADKSPTAVSKGQNGAGGDAHVQPTQLLPRSRPLGKSGVVDHGVRCMTFTRTGQLAVGLQSGHVCILKLKQG